MSVNKDGVAKWRVVLSTERIYCSALSNIIILRGSNFETAGEMFETLS